MFSEKKTKNKQKNSILSVNQAWIFMWVLASLYVLHMQNLQFL